MSLNNGWPKTPLPPPTNAGPDRDVTAPDDAAPHPHVHWSGKDAHGLWHINSGEPPTSPDSPNVLDPGAPDSDPEAALFSGFIDGDDDDGGGLTTSFAGNGGGGAASGNQSVSFNVSVAGSGLVFHNTITSGFSQALENCIIAAEQTLASNWTNSITLNISFSASNQGNNGNLASNSFYVQDVSYSALRAALVAHDGGSSFGQTAAASLPLTDPNPAGGADWMLPEAYARMLGLSSATASVDDYVSLNTSYNWSYGQDVTNTLIHEISEGAMGRVGGLGDQNSAWSTMDLFRFNASGTRDYTDGRDGQTAYFSYNGGQWLSSSTGLSFNNEYTLGKNGAAQANSGDTADWNQLDVFGTGSPGETNTLSQTDLAVMDVLGWTPAGSAPSSPAGSTPSVPTGTTANLVTETSSSGALQVYNLGNSALLASAAPGTIPAQQRLLGSGNLSGNGGNTDLLMRDPSNNNLTYYDIQNNKLVASGAAGNIGNEWQVLGFADFSGNTSETDMLMRNVNTNDLQYFDIQQNQVVRAGPAGNIGGEWQVLGFGDFSGNANEADMLMRNVNTNDLQYFDIQQNQVVRAGPAGNIGSEWQVLGFADFSGNANETDLLMRNVNTNDLQYFDIQQNQVVRAGPAGNIGSEWQVMGFANITGNPNETDMLMRNSGTAAVVYFGIQHNQVVSSGSLGSVATVEQVLALANLSPASS